MPQYILQTKELCKEFAHTAAVNRVSMNIQQGDIYGFIGENGAGKTTFMRMVAGLASPTSGTIRLFGQENLQAGRHYIGCTIENPALYKNMTARENLEIFRHAFGVKNTKSTDKVLSLMGLADTGRKRVGDFSLGMKQRLAIAVALLGNPQFLILDEPINGLDPVGIQELRNLFVQLNREQNITLLISSHILGELSKIATRYGIIHKGSLVSELSADDLMDRDVYKRQSTTCPVPRRRAFTTSVLSFLPPRQSPATLSFSREPMTAPALCPMLGFMWATG